MAFKIAKFGTGIDAKLLTDAAAEEDTGNVDSHGVQVVEFCNDKDGMDGVHRHNS